MAPLALEHSVGHWSRPPSHPGQDQLCLARSLSHSHALVVIPRGARREPGAVEGPELLWRCCLQLIFFCSTRHAPGSPIRIPWSWSSRAVPPTSILSLIHISEPTRRTPISYAVF